jgi:hypothetical protein
MHAYSADGRSRESIYGLIALLSVGLAWGLGAAFQQLAFSPPWWLDTPAVLGFYGLIWRGYDRRAWRWGARTASLSKVSYYGGEWIGCAHSDFAGGTDTDARLVIDQTASNIVVSLITEHSRSNSDMAMIRSDGALRGLHYSYLSEPRPLAAMTMQSHRGYSHIQLSSDGMFLDGEYRNDARRGTSGRLTFRRA